ncbi:hypothetical protein KR222_001954, partial [Zaprionus bogoriensis]
VMWYSNNKENFPPELYHLYALVLQLIGNETDLFLYNAAELECHWSSPQLKFTDQPQFVWNSEVAYSVPWKHHKSEIFVLACLSDFNVKKLEELSRTLRLVKNVKILLELPHWEEFSDDSLATDILSYFRIKNMLNVALYFRSTIRPLMLYSFEAFPQFELIKRRITTDLPLYPNQLKNLRGYALKVMHDFSEPNTIMYNDSSGQERHTGYMWHFIETFAGVLGARINALHPTWLPGRLHSEPHMIDLTRNGTVDIALLTTQMSTKFAKYYRQYSYPILYSSWCIMLPLERPIEIKEIFAHVWKVNALALLIMMVLLFSISGEISDFRFLYCLRLAPRLLTLFTVCMCLAQLCHLMVKRPQLTPIKSFDDLITSHLHIFGLRAEFDILDDDFRARYADAFRLTSNLSEFYRTRNSFNTSWAYSVSTLKWYIFAEQQRYFQRPLFRFSEVCFHEGRPQSILLAENSIYREELKLFTMRLHQGGLLRQWMQHSLYDMIKAGRMHLKDHSIDNPIEPLSVQDFQLAWRWCGVGLLLALSAFVVELLRFYVNVCLELL